MARLRDVIRLLLAPVLLFVAGLSFRALPYPTVVTKNAGIQPLGDHAFYHLRRIQYAALNPGDFLSTDPYLNYPDGGQPIWSPAFDWLLALGVRLAGVAHEPAAMELLLVWVPPIIGASTVVAFYGIAQHYFSTRVAVAGAALLCFLPASTWYSQIGFVDHPVAVALVTTLLLGSATALLGQEQEDSSPTSACLGRACFLGVAMGASLLVWPGTLLHVAIVQLAVGIRVLAAGSRGSGIAWARTLALAHAIACVAVIPWSAGNQWEVWGSFSPVVLSNFQPVWLSACAIGFALLSELWRREYGAGTRLARSLTAIVVAAAGLGVALLLLPELADDSLQGWIWISRDESFRAGAAESAPLFRTGPVTVQALFTRFVYLTPLALALVIWDRRRSLTPSLWLLLGWSVGLFLATLMQRRFMNSSSIVYSLFLAAALDVVLRRFVWRDSWGPLSRAGAAVVFAGLVGWALWPSLAHYGVDLVNLQRSSRDEPLRYTHAKRIQLLESSAAQWIRRITPETSGFLDRSVQPEYAVLTPWYGGDVINYVGRRPIVQDSFGSDIGDVKLELTNRYYASNDEKQAVSILEEMGVRYVVSGAVEMSRTGGDGPHGMLARLSLSQDGGQRRIGSTASRPEVPVTRLAHHRLIHETVPLDGSRGEGHSTLELYEVVPGARVEGSAPPGTRVEAQLSLYPAAGQELRFVAVALADASGRYALTVPYPNEAFSEGMRSAETYTLTSPLGEASFRVSEAAVRAGDRIEGPSLAR